MSEENKIIYVVFGSSFTAPVKFGRGISSEKECLKEIEKWTVKSFYDRKQAESFVKKCNLISKMIFGNEDRNDLQKLYYKPELGLGIGKNHQGLHKFDKNYKEASGSENPTEYFIEEVELDESVYEEQEKEEQNEMTTEELKNIFRKIAQV